MAEMLKELNAENEKENSSEEAKSATENKVSVGDETVNAGTDAAISEEKEVKPENAEAERPKPVPKKNRRGSKALQAELEKTQILAEENKEKYQRLLAEFDNVRARYDKENKKEFDKGAKDTILKLLPVVDNFERAIEYASEEDKNSNYGQGIEMIYKMLMDTLAKMGVEPMNAVGKQFDPTYHCAVNHVESDEYGENVVIEEMQKGYMYKDQIVRHSMVNVAN